MALASSGVPPSRPLRQPILLRELTPAEKTDHQELLNRAIARLTDAVAAGFDDLDQLQSDPDLTPLRPNPAFQTLLERLK